MLLLFMYCIIYVLCSRLYYYFKYNSIYIVTYWKYINVVNIIILYLFIHIFLHFPAFFFLFFFFSSSFFFLFMFYISLACCVVVLCWACSSQLLQPVSGRFAVFFSQVPSFHTLFSLQKTLYMKIFDNIHKIQK